MLYREINDADISLLGFGAMRLPTESGGEEINYERAKKLVDAAMASGVNYYDTAYVYHHGKSEPFLGRALAEYPRDSYFLADKLPLWLVESPAHAREILEEQLARCNTEYFDFYLFHSMQQSYVEKMEAMGLWEVLSEAKKAGKIRRLGFSFHDTPEVLEKLCGAHQWDFAQLMYNYIDAEHTRAARQYEILQQHGIPCIVMEPVRGGRLADLGTRANAVLKEAQPSWSIAAWAMRWLAQQGNILTILSGMNDESQLADNVNTLSSDAPLTERQKQALEEAVGIFKEYALVPCTGCRYCMPCPSGVDIPKMLSLRNEAALTSSEDFFAEEYAEVPAEQRASNCIACGACEAVCPQHLAISGLMKEITRDTRREG